jgi:hypothetical protein
MPIIALPTEIIQPEQQQFGDGKEIPVVKAVTQEQYVDASIKNAKKLFH